MDNEQPDCVRTWPADLKDGIYVVMTRWAGDKTHVFSAGIFNQDCGWCTRSTLLGHETADVAVKPVFGPFTNYAQTVDALREHASRLKPFLLATSDFEAPNGKRERLLNWLA